MTAPQTPPGKAHPDRTIPTPCLRERKARVQVASKEGRVHLDLVLVRADRKVLVVQEDRQGVGDI